MIMVSIHKLSFLTWIGAGQRTYKKGFPAFFALCPPHQDVMLWPPCVRCSRSQGTRSSYLNGSTKSCTFHKKCSGYQRLLATAYRLSLARSDGSGPLAQPLETQVSSVKDGRFNWGIGSYQNKQS